MSSNTQVLWGTNINATNIQSQLREFLTTFIQATDDDNVDMNDDGEMPDPVPFYIKKLREINDTEDYTLNVDCDDMYTFNQQLYKQLEDYPTDVIPIFDLVAAQVYNEYVKNYSGNQDGLNSMGQNDMEQNDQIIQVRPFNMRKVFQIRELDPSQIDKLVTLKGIIIRTSDTIPEMKEANFKCSKCQKEEFKFVERGKITEPDYCDNCRGRGTFEMIHNWCMFSDKQHIKMQETPEAVPEGETPQTVHMCAYEDLVDYVKPGDRCEVVGIYRAQGIRTNPHVRTLKNIYRTYIDVIGYTKTDSKRYENGPLDGNKEQQDDAQANDDLHGLEEEAQEEQELGLGGEGDGGFTKEKVAEFHKLAQNPLVYDLLIDALAPSIWECHDVKKGILCQLFGGCSKSFSSSGRGRFRGEINILLCGDPSTAKSQLL